MPAADDPRLSDRVVAPGDYDIVAAARRGEPWAWRVLHDDIAGRLLLWLSTTRISGRGRAGDVVATDPDDIAAEAWLTAARRIHDFSGDSDGFAGWIFGIARNIAANERRKAVRRATSPTDDLPEVADSGLDPAGDVAARDLTRRLLSMLPAREAEVVACREVVGLDVAATSQALGISRASVRVAHHRGLGKLRSALAELPTASSDRPGVTALPATVGE